jgi:hypothetical protein
MPSASRYHCDITTVWCPLAATILIRGDLLYFFIKFSSILRTSHTTLRSAALFLIFTNDRAGKCSSQTQPAFASSYNAARTMYVVKNVPSSQIRPRVVTAPKQTLNAYNLNRRASEHRSPTDLCTLGGHNRSYASYRRVATGVCTNFQNWRLAEIHAETLPAHGPDCVRTRRVARLVQEPSRHWRKSSIPLGAIPPTIACLSCITRPWPPCPSAAT